MPPQIRVNFPSVNELLESPQLRSLVDRVNRHAVMTGVKSFLDNLRTEVQQTAAEIKVLSPSELAEKIAKWILHTGAKELRPVINGTGVLLHEGLGGAPLAAEAVHAITNLASGYACADGEANSVTCSSQNDTVEKLLRQLIGSEAAVVVNNFAAARLLCLTAIAADKSVLVSRGHLVEGSDGLRLADTIAASRARLREVGSTNRTRIGDYETAVEEQTAALLHVRSIHFLQCGATEQATLEELVELGRKRNLPVIDDLEFGALIDCGRFGLKEQPLVSTSIAAGANAVIFRGDRMLGGPACGIVAGDKSLIQNMRQHPLFRALSVDNLTLAGLTTTLQLYTDEETALRCIPLLSLLSTPIENLKNRAERLAPQLVATEVVRQAEAMSGTTYLSGVTIPSQELGTWTISLTPSQGSASELATLLGQNTPAILGRVEQERFLIDLRTVLPSQDMQVVEALQQLRKPKSE